MLVSEAISNIFCQIVNSPLSLDSSLLGPMPLKSNLVGALNTAEELFIDVSVFMDRTDGLNNGFLAKLTIISATILKAFLAPAI